ncbi:uncharacterized protein MONBRDRAFT_2386, partial [Monosiga brevicollis MX1]
EPAYWRQHIDNIRHMRRHRNAPVDSMGCETLTDPNTPPAVARFHVLVSLMLSSQTKDAMTAAATRRLQALPGGLTPKSMASMEPEAIAQVIYGVGFWRRKGEYIHKTAKILLAEHNGDVPATIAELVKLPGVGMKMAQIAMAVAHNTVTGIGIDVHCHRIANRLAWCDTAQKTPEHTRVALERWLPRELWGEINLLLVGFGQQICLPRGPKCHSCLNRDICPAA